MGEVSQQFAVFPRHLPHRLVVILLLCSTSVEVATMDILKYDRYHYGHTKAVSISFDMIRTSRSEDAYVPQWRTTSAVEPLNKRPFSIFPFSSSNKHILLLVSDFSFSGF